MPAPKQAAQGRRRRPHTFVDKRHNDHVVKEHQEAYNRLPPEKRPRLMADFSAEELAILQAKLEDWMREGTGRVGSA